MKDASLSEVRTLIVSAWLPEQEELLAELSHGRAVIQVDDSLRIAGEFAFLLTGVGTPRAALAVASALSRSEQSKMRAVEMYFVATAGAYNPAIPLNTAFCAGSVLWSDGDLFAGRSYLPEAAGGAEMLDTTFESEEGGFNLTPVRAISTPGITVDSGLAGQLCALAELENLELYGVAIAARKFGVRCSAFLGVSNTVCPDAHVQWRKNHRSASAAAQSLLKSVLAGKSPE